MLEFNYHNLKRMVFGSSSERSRAVADQATETGKVVNMFDAATEQQLKEDYFGIIAEKEAEEKALEEKYDTSSRKPKKKIVYKPTGRKEFPKNLLRKKTIIEPKGIDLSKATLIGQDKTEILNYTPATIWVEATIRNKYITKDKQSGAKTFHQSPALKDKRALPKLIIEANADLMVDEKQNPLTVQLHSLATNRYNEAAGKLAELLNQTETVFPGTDLRLIFKNAAI